MIGNAVNEPEPLCFTQLRRPLQKPGVQIEHVARIGFAPRRPTEQQRDLPICLCMLGQIIVDAEGVLFVVEEVLAHRAACVGGEI